MGSLKSNRVMEIVHALEQDILSGALKPGDRLDERGLSERFNVSRTPVREALGQLSATGLITSAPRRAAVVASVTFSDLVEMFEVMAEMESLCARLCARRMARPELVALEGTLDGCRMAMADQDPDLYYLRNVDFHEAIYKGSRNKYLERHTLQLRYRLAPYRRLQLHRQGRMTASDAEHQAIIDAIRVGDEDAAGAEMRRHVTVQGANLNDLIALLPRG